MRRHAAAEQMRDAIDERARLARAGARDDEQRTVAEGRGRVLLRIQLRREVDRVRHPDASKTMLRHVGPPSAFCSSDRSTAATVKPRASSFARVRGKRGGHHECVADREHARRPTARSRRPASTSMSPNVLVAAHSGFASSMPRPAYVHAVFEVQRALHRHRTHRVTEW